MGPTWVLSAPDEPHDGPMNFAIKDALRHQQPPCWFDWYHGAYSFNLQSKICLWSVGRSATRRFYLSLVVMITPCCGNASRIAGPLWWESTDLMNDGFSHKGPFMRNFNIFFVAMQLPWFKTPRRSCDITVMQGCGLPDTKLSSIANKQRVLMHRHQGWNVRHGLCHIYMRYLYIYELFIAFVCFVVCSLL